jgi:hypothetical protein
MLKERCLSSTKASYEDRERGKVMVVYRGLLYGGMLIGTYGYRVLKTGLSYPYRIDPLRGSLYWVSWGIATTGGLRSCPIADSFGLEKKMTKVVVRKILVRYNNHSIRGFS